MNTKKYLVPIALATLTLTACGTTTTTEPSAAPSSSAAASSGSAVKDLERSRGDSVDQERAAAAEAGLPSSLDIEYALAVAKDHKPFVVGTAGCGWVRLPDDGSLWALHDTGSPALTRDHAAESAWRADPDRDVPRCKPVSGIPTADDPTAAQPYRWTADYGNQYLRWGGKVYILPSTVGVGLALTPVS